MTPYLNKKYNEIISIDTITEKDIIYFCRDALSTTVSSQNKIIYEKEILILIKLKEWDWFAVDIDKNIILSYSIYNNAFEIVKYLLDNNKYNIKEYNESLSHALQSCIMLTGETMLTYLISKDIHSEYIADLLFRAYQMSDYVMPVYKKDYVKKVQELMNLKADFDKILVKFLKADDFLKVKDTFYEFLDEYPILIERKMKAVGDVLQKLEETKSSVKSSEKYRKLKKWLHYHELNEKILSKEITGYKKFKI